MTKKTTKRSLLLSALSLLMCVSMLIGSTFAWFTDSVTSGRNIIQAGNLDVTLKYWDGTKYADVTNETKLFNDAALWEPGHTEVAYLEVGNAGSLELKYQLAVNVYAETTGVTEDGKEIKLSDYLVFSVVDKQITSDADLYTREGAIAAAGNSRGLKAYNSGTTPLTVGEKDYVALIIYMPETVGNEANYKTGTTAPSITLGTTLHATQYTAEFDSFGMDYDKDAWHPEMKVTNANDLQAAINNGVTNITLENNIDLTESIVIPAAPATFTRRAAPTPVVINLNGKTISANNTKSAGAAIVNNGYAIINGDANSVVSNNAMNGAPAVLNNGVLVLNGGTYVGAPSDIANSKTASYAVNTAGAGAELTVNGANISGRGAIGATEGAKVVINGGNYHTPAVAWGHAVYAVDEGTEVIINDGTFSEGYEMSGNNYGMYQIYSGNKAKVTVNGGTFKDWDCANGYDLCTATEGVIEIKGGTFAEDPSKQNNLNYVADGFKAIANADGTYSVVFPQESFDSLIDNAQPNATIEIPAGNYTFPASKLEAGQTLECAPGTVFEGNSKLNINGATVVGATFSNPTGTAADQTINGTFKDCVFEGKNGLRWCYAGDTVVFENCTFSGDVYGVHFDGGANEVIFKNCTFSGFNALGGAITKATFEGCTFKPNGKSSYNGINMWGSTEMTGCTFVFDGSTTEWIDACGDNKTYTFTDCIVTDGKTEKGVETVIGDYGTGNTITVNGVRLVHSNTNLKAAVAAGATKVLLADGEYDLNGNQKGGLTLVGVGSNVKVANTTKYASGKATGAIWQAINLENVTVTNTVYTMADGGKATFTNVNFAAGFRQGYGTGVVFNNCTFGSNSEGYALHFQTDSASEGGLIKLNGCKFEGGKVHLGGKRAYEFTNCDFAAGTDFQVWSNITLDGCTVNGEEVTAENMATLFPNLNAAKVTLK